MIEMIEKIADYKVERNYQLNKPKGVRGRSSDNSLIEKINWKPDNTLMDGLKKTYSWIESQIKSNSNVDKFCQSSLEK